MILGEKSRGWNRWGPTSPSWLCSMKTGCPRSLGVPVSCSHSSGVWGSQRTSGIQLSTKQTRNNHRMVGPEDSSYKWCHPILVSLRGKPRPRGWQWLARFVKELGRSLSPAQLCEIFAASSTDNLLSWIRWRLCSASASASKAIGRPTLGWGAHGRGGWLSGAWQGQERGRNRSKEGRLYFLSKLQSQSWNLPQRNAIRELFSFEKYLVLTT